MKKGMLVKVNEKLVCVTGSSVGVVTEVINDFIAKVDVRGQIFKFWLGDDFELVPMNPNEMWGDFGFYVYSFVDGYKKCSSLKEAIKLFNEKNDEKYVAIGVEDSQGAIDIYCKKEAKKWSSYDLRAVPRFYYNALIRVNSIKIIERECS